MMENERSERRVEAQAMAQVDKPRGEPKACNHLMLYHVRPPSMAASTLSVAVRTAFDAHGQPDSRGGPAGLHGGDPFG
eukprot:4986071-Pleurochrysis_carterae.AAC.1